MANKKKKRRSVNTRSKRTSSKRKKTDKNLQFLILTILSVLLGVLIYVKSGYIGKNLSPILGGVMGVIKYIVPVGTFLIGISLLHEDKDYLKSKLIQYIIVIMCICSIMTISQVKSRELNMNDDLSDIINTAYNLGSQNKGGGITGVIIAYPMIKLFGMLGATTISIGMALILIIFTFGIKPGELIDSVINALNGKRDIEEDEEEYEEEIVENIDKIDPRNKKLNKKNKILKPTSKEIAAIQEDIEDQITINNSNEEVEFNSDKKHNIKLPSFMEKKTKPNPEVIEANPFREAQ